MKPVNTPDVAIDVQLQKIGLSPDDIKYVVASHMHLDHGGNIAKFPNSTIVLQRDEIEYAMWPDEPFTGPFIPADAAVLRAPVGSNKPNAFDMLILDDDMDLFGDGSVIVKGGRARQGPSDDGRAPAQHGYARPDRGQRLLPRERGEAPPPNLVLAYDPAGIMRAYDFIRHASPRTTRTPSRR